MTLTLDKEEAMCLDVTLRGPDRTVRVQVNITFETENGVRYYSTREIKMRLRRETDVDIASGR